MTLFLILLCMICPGLLWACARLRGDIHALSRQLEEIMQESHIELTVNSRQKCMLELCGKLNRVLSLKDADYLQYKKAEKQLKQDIANLAHDIRTPLTGASGYVQLARECEAASKKEYYLQTAENRLAELEDMLEKLFLYTKLTGEDYSLSPENRKEIQVLPLLGDCLLSLHAQFEKAGTAPELDFPSEDFRVYAEEEALRRIFLNLIQNALIHGAGGLRISQGEVFAQGNTVSAGIVSDKDNFGFSAETTSEDDSISMTLRKGSCCLVFENPVSSDCAPDASRIFDRFYKADPARRKGSSGLGLFIVRELMRKMDGEAIARISNCRLQIILIFNK